MIQVNVIVILQSRLLGQTSLKVQIISDFLQGPNWKQTSENIETDIKLQRM
jgi:hypothetical protein